MNKLEDCAAMVAVFTLVSDGAAGQLWYINALSKFVSSVGILLLGFIIFCFTTPVFNC